MAGNSDTQELTAAPDVAYPFRVCSVSEKGSREQNEDNMVRFDSPYGHVVIVADGMGGHGHGDLASALVVNGFQESLSKRETADISIPDAIKAACSAVNATILQMVVDLTHSVMGSTVVLVILHRGEFYVAHVGDSRAYLIRDGVLSRLTKDHSLVQREVDEGLLTEEQARQDSRSSTLTRALGTPNGENIEIRGPEPLQDGDGILLCSDGLHGFALDRQIEDAILYNQQDPQKVTTGLVNLAIGTYFSNDNVTVQYVQIGKPKPATVRPVFGRSKAGAEVAPPRNPSKQSAADHDEQRRKRSLMPRTLLWLPILVVLGAFAYWFAYWYAHRPRATHPAPPKPASSISKGQAGSSKVMAVFAQEKPATKIFLVGAVISNPSLRVPEGDCRYRADLDSRGDINIVLHPEGTDPKVGAELSPNPNPPCAIRPPGVENNPYNVDELIIDSTQKPS